MTNAFLHSTLDESVYCERPSDFVDPAHLDHVCFFHKALYGLKQAPHAWYHRFATYISFVGFLGSNTDTSLFIYRRGSDAAYLLLYVDDILLIASSSTLLRSLITSLQGEFDLKDLGPLHYFLGISATRSSSGLFLAQHKYTAEIIARAHMTNCKPCNTPVDTNSKLSAAFGPPASDPTLYRNLAGALQYLTFTKLNIYYAVQQICLFMHEPRAPHFAALKRIIRYITGTIAHGLHLVSSRSSSLVAYSNADWVGCPDTRWSTSSYYVSWK